MPKCNETRHFPALELCVYKNLKQNVLSCSSNRRLRKYFITHSLPRYNISCVFLLFHLRPRDAGSRAQKHWCNISSSRLQGSRFARGVRRPPACPALFCTLDLAHHAPGLRANRVKDGGRGGGVPAVTSSSWAKMRGGIFRPLRGGVRRINFTLVISHAADDALLCALAWNTPSGGNKVLSQKARRKFKF